MTCPDCQQHRDALQIAADALQWCEDMDVKFSEGGSILGSDPATGKDVLGDALELARRLLRSTDPGPSLPLPCAQCANLIAAQSAQVTCRLCGTFGGLNGPCPTYRPKKEPA